MYDGRGAVLSESINPWRYNCKRHDPEMNLIYYGNRYYDPNLGRWITPDPIEFEGGPNLYAFVSNNPFSHLDLYGLFEETPWEGKEPEPRSFVSKAIRAVGRIIECIGDYLVPVPYVREAISYLGHKMAGGNRETFKNKGFTGKSHYFNLGKPELNPKANIIDVNGILTTPEGSRKNAEQISKANGNNNVHGVHKQSRHCPFYFTTVIPFKKNIYTQGKF